MLMCIADVLTADEVARMVAQLGKAQFVDGKLTAGWHAKLVKHNLQAQAGSSSVVPQLQQQVLLALLQHPLFDMAVRPKAIRPALFSRYEPGMSYGTHVDNAVMGDMAVSGAAVGNAAAGNAAMGNDGGRMRSDVSLTLFLSDPATYTGGELVIESTQGEQAFKLPAGAMIIYPSSTLHRVEPVTQGVRLAAVTWVQSLVRDLADREILFDLDTARKAVFEQYGKTPEFDLLSKSLANLLRKWVDV
jgi:PKHD-type hydroxylase